MDRPFAGPVGRPRFEDWMLKAVCFLGPLDLESDMENGLEGGCPLSSWSREDIATGSWGFVIGMYREQKFQMISQELKAGGGKRGARV